MKSVGTGSEGRDEGVNCSALLTWVSEVVRAQGVCVQRMPVGAAPVMVTGDAKPLEGVMVKEYAGAAVPATVDEEVGATLKAKSGVGGALMVSMAVAVCVRAPETAVKVKV